MSLINLVYSLVSRAKKSPTAIGFCYLFLVMACYYILKPVRESFFLGEQGYQNLPKAHLLVLAATFFTMMAYTSIARRLGPGRLILTANVFFLFSVGVFWVVLTQFGDQPFIRTNMAWAYYCWVSVFSVFAVTLFWSVIHTIFTSEDGSKSYGFIGAGATVGAMTGGFLTQWLAERLGTENLLLVAGGLLMPCLFLGWWLAKFSSVSKSLAESGPTEKKKFDRTQYRSGFKIFRESPYLCALGGIVFMTILISVFDDYRSGKIISEAYPRTTVESVTSSATEVVTESSTTEAAEANIQGENSRTAFFGKLYFYTNMVGLFFSFVLTGPIQARYGPAPGMYLYAVAILGTALAFLWQPSIHVVFWGGVCIQSIAYSIFQWSRELLYTVTTAEEKFVAKGVIDTFLFRAGAAGAAITLLIAATIGVTESRPDGILTEAARQMSYVTIPAALLMVVLIWWISREFRIKSENQTSAR